MNRAIIFRNNLCDTDLKLSVFKPKTPIRSPVLFYTRAELSEGSPQTPQDCRRVFFTLVPLFSFCDLAHSILLV